MSINTAVEITTSTSIVESGIKDPLHMHKGHLALCRHTHAAGLCYNSLVHQFSVFSTKVEDRLLQ